jgi:hypothetical protein
LRTKQLKVFSEDFLSVDKHWEPRWALVLNLCADFSETLGRWKLFAVGCQDIADVCLVATVQQYLFVDRIDLLVVLSRSLRRFIVPIFTGDGLNC